MCNKLYYGDNLEILRRYIKDESVDLIYLDPPFQSGKDYNILFEEKDGTKSTAQIKAFDDTWHWDQTAENTFNEIMSSPSPTKVKELMQGLRNTLGSNDMMAYLTMMAIRLVELKRVLKITGSIYLHCDQTASHYLKILLDAIFGIKNFRNNIVWCYKTRQFSKKYWNRKHDDILFYTKGNSYPFNYNEVLNDYADSTIKKFKLKDEKGYYRIVGRGIKGSQFKSAKDLTPEQELQYPDLITRSYIKEGYPPEDYWFMDILNQVSKERLGYPTQKPESLLEKIIKASSNKGDIVLDPFCGCGTSITVAERLNRKWIGIDITHLAINVMKYRLNNSFGQGLKYKVIGEPCNLADAKALATEDKYQFQFWALGLVNARPSQSEEKKGMDRGIDGTIYFFDSKENFKKIIIQVKSGHVTASQIRDLKGTVDREKAQIGVFICLEDPTREMTKEAVSSGFYNSELGKNYPKLQILTIKELLNGKKIDAPLMTIPFKKAELADTMEQIKIDGI